MLTVEAFDGAREAFMALPGRLYGGDRRWIPPFRKEEEAALSGDHPFRDFLTQRHFLALRDGKPVGRASAFVNPLITEDGAPLGTIGRFECEEDQEAATRLIDIALAWLGTEGVKMVWGPMNGTIWAPYRLMTQGFEAMPFYGEPYNKPYYPQLFEGAGFTAFKHWRSDIVLATDMRPIVAKTRLRYDKALGEGYMVRPLDMRRFDDELAILHLLITDSFAGFAGFHAISKEAFIRLYGGMKALALPDLIQFLHDPQGEVAGYMCILPDYPGAIRAMRGQTHLLAKLRFALAKRKPAHYVVLYLGVSKQEQARRGGAGGAIAYIGAHLIDRDQITLISALMAEDSFARSWTHGRQQSIREYALYKRSIG